MVLRISDRERLLLGAALRSDARAAIRDWECWTSEIKLESAPYPELRLLPSVYANFSRIASSYPLPRKLRGKARATFIQNDSLARASIPIIDEIAKRCPVIIAKGLAVCVRFDCWSARIMGDVDIHVPFAGLAVAADVLAREGWSPKYGMTWDSLVNRTALRRDSWNFSKGRGDIDLHWRVRSGRSEDWLTKRMWDSAEQHTCMGRHVLLQSPEFATVTAIAHGFKNGTHGDALQSVVDGAALLPLCNPELLLPLARRFDVLLCLQELLTVLEVVGRAQSVSHLSKLVADLSGAQLKKGAIRRVVLRPARPKPERTLLHHPFVYKLWESLGRRRWLERVLLRWLGPFSKPLAPLHAFTSDYDLRVCKVIDQIGGPGWGWPEPEHTCFWSDRADSRLLIPLRRVGDYMLVFGVAKNWSPNRNVDVFANGSYLTRIEFHDKILRFYHCFMIPRSLLFGAWVELSFRPSSYRGKDVQEPEDYMLMRCVPARRLEVLDATDAGALISGQHVPVPDIQLKILRGEEPYAGKFAGVKAKIENSRLREHAALPADFDPYTYILLYPDLLAAEVDPYEHFIRYGKSENRSWR